MRAELLDIAQEGDAALYLASYENKLVSKVVAGENRGRTLSGVAAFVQNRRTAEVLQALLLPACPG